MSKRVSEIHHTGKHELEAEAEDRVNARNERIESNRRERLLNMFMRMAERHVKSKRGASWAEVSEALGRASAQADLYADDPYNFPHMQKGQS